MITLPLRLMVCRLVLVAAFAALATGCSGARTAGGDEDAPVDRAAGRQLFQQTCRVCHSLADANAAGTFGPDLDQLQPDSERVREQIADGGGGMPQDLLKGEDAELVAKYVAEVAGNAPEPGAPAPGGAAGEVVPQPTGDSREDALAALDPQR